LRTTPGVAWARPDGVARIAAPLPDDPQFQQQYGFRNTGQAGGLVDADVDAPEGWEAAGLSPSWPASGGVKIGFVDTGLDKTHPEFSGRVAGCVHTETGAIVDGCKDGNGHGTHVVGIAAASTNNGTGVAGLSFDSPIYSCRALGANGFGNDSDVAACINWLVDQGVKVINMSLTVDDPSTIQGSVVDAWNGGAGALLVAAAGNTGNTTPQYPAAFAGVVSVGNTNSADVINAGSSHNPDVELSAPGTSIYSTYRGAAYATLTGTSMASPIVAGVAAITWWLHPAETAQQIRNRLHVAVDDLGAVGRDPYYGFGRINLCLAAGGSCTYAPSSPSAGAIAGTVKNTGGQPLKARVVVVTGPTAASTRSNAATGVYTLSGLTPGAYSVKAKRKGCTALTKPVTVSASATATLNFALTCA
jgi:subtilisin family serine protease